MNLIYNITFENSELNKSYHITNDRDDDIGTVEAYGNEYGELVAVVKIYNPNFKRKGFGFQAFKKVFDEINAVVEVTTIKGSWHAGGEFQDFDDGMSTNLQIFKDRSGIETAENSAFETPTGKWAKALGFSTANIKSIRIEEVNVDFTK